MTPLIASLPSLTAAVTTERAPIGVAFGLGPFLMLVGALVSYVGVRAMRGDLERNRLLGIRTNATLASDAAWQAAHRAGGPWLIAAGAGALVPGAITLFRPSNDTVALSTMVGMGLMVALVAVASLAANSAADDVSDSAP